MNLIKRAETITRLGITGIVFDVICIVLLIASFVVPITSVRGGLVKENDIYLYAGLLIFGVVVLVVAIILSWVGSILVLATNWNDQKLERDRILWGLLSIFLLGSIAIIIFGVQAKNRVQDNTQVILEPETVIQA